MSGYAEKLGRQRDQQKRTFVYVTKEGYMREHDGGRHAHIEQPWNALSWRMEGGYEELPGHFGDIAQRAKEAEAKDRAGNIIGKCQKRTKIKTTIKASLAQGVSCKCSCTESHSWCKDLARLMATDRARRTYSFVIIHSKYRPTAHENGIEKQPTHQPRTAVVSCLQR